MTAAVPARGREPRAMFIDHLRAAVVLLVILHHAAQPYGPTGGAWPLIYPRHSAILGPFFHVNASFFMGLLFLVSAYFLPGSYDRKGARRFLADRFLRLGVPIAAMAFVVFPLCGYAMNGKPAVTLAHMWFVEHLLVYALLYTLWRAVVRSGPAKEPQPFPRNRAIFAYAIALAAVSSAVRIWYPIDRWVVFPVQAELAHVPQYASLFVIGLVAYRLRWLEQIPDPAGRLWLGIGLACAAWRYSYTLTPVKYISAWLGKAAPVFWNTWEALLCAGLCIGSLWLFQRRWNRPSTFSRFLVRNSYAVYIIHLPVLVAIQLAFQRTGWHPLLLTGVTGVLAAAACYAIGALLLRRIPGASRVL